MGEAKRIAEAEQQYRSKKISFIREWAPSFLSALMINPNVGNRVNAVDWINFTADFFDEIEKKAKEVALGENND